MVTDAEHLQRVFTSLQEEFLRTGNIACNSRDVEQYSRKIQAEGLATLVKTLLSSTPHA